MRLSEDGDFIVSPDEMFTLRQGLFITVYHLDPAFEEDLHSITGRVREDFHGLMQKIDDLER
jgi:hypothetical protein